MITGMITNFMTNVVIPSLLAEAAIAMPIFGVALQIPLIGDGIRKVITWFSEKMITKGFITIKTNLIDILSEKAKAEYAPQIAIIRAAQAQDDLTPEQEAEFAEKYQNAVRHRPDIVNG